MTRPFKNPQARPLLGTLSQFGFKPSERRFEIRLGSTTTRSTSAGDCRFDNLTVGIYTISASPAGLSKAEVRNVEVKLNFTITANINV